MENYKSSAELAQSVQSMLQKKFIERRMYECCVVSVSFRLPYIIHSKRQEIFIKTSSAKTDILIFRDEFPSKDGIIGHNIVEYFQKNLYGFKPHAINYVLNSEKLLAEKRSEYYLENPNAEPCPFFEEGYKKVIWLDPSVLPISSIQILVDSLDIHPIIIVKGDAPLAKMCNEKSKNWFGVTDEDIRDVKHIGGTIYGFNFNHPKVVEVFNLWKKSEEEGIFGTQDDFMKGHWADESCMALAMYKCGVPQYWEEKFRYLNQKEL